MNFEIVKKHPVAFGAIALVGGLFLYLIIRGNGSKSAPGSITTTTAPTNQYDAQLAAVSAGAAVQMTQANASVAVAQLAADTQALQIAAALKVTQDTNAANVAVANINANRDVTISDITTTGAVQQTALQVAGATDIAHAQADVLISQISAQSHVADLLAQIQQSQIASQKDIATSTLQLIQSGQLNKGGAGGAHQIDALAAIYNQPSIAQSAEMGGAVQNASSASMWSNIASAGAKVLTGLFG